MFEGLFVADYNNRHSESNEGNNVVALQFTVSLSTKDVKVEDARLSETSVYSGASIYAYSYLVNAGSQSLSSAYLGYYLSKF